MALARQSSARLVPDAGGGASRTQAAQVSGLAAGAGPTWPRLPRGQAGPCPGGRGPSTRRAPPHCPKRCLQGAWGGHNKVKAPSKRRERKPQKTSRRQPRQPPPTAEGFRLTLKAARIPPAAFPAAVGRLGRSLPPSRGRPHARATGGGGVPLLCPKPPGRMGPPKAVGGRRERRPNAPVLRSRLPRPRRGLWSRAPGGGEGPAGSQEGREVGAFPRVPARGEAGSQNSVCGRSCWQSPGNAPATRVEAGTLCYSQPGLASQERVKGPSPAAARPPPPD